VKTWKLTLEYDGTRYSGWAEQRNAPRTVMGELRKALEVLFHGKVDLGGAGRTDAGVHARGQVAHVRTDSKQTYAPEQMVRMLNQLLPADMAVLKMEPAPARFHARHDAVGRAYVYQIATRKTAFAKKYVWWVKEPLDVARMSAAAALIVGRHNFTRFRANDAARPDESPIVVVHSASIEEREGLIVFHIEASHFIWRMVRRLTGALVRVGRGELKVEEFSELLAGRGAKHDVASWTAPGSGLALERVLYSGL
jgi:tRNA pseudouridine38-40 synthase